MHLKHFPLFRLFNRKPRGQGVYLWLAGCQTGCLHFRQSLHTKLWNILLIFHTFDPRNIFYICLNDSWIIFHRQEHGQLFLKCLAEKDSCTGKKSNQLTKKTMIQRFSLWNTWLATTLTRCALLGDGRVLVAGGYHGFGQTDPSDLSSSEVDTIPWFGFWSLLYA